MGRNEFPDLFELGERCSMEYNPAHERRRSWLFSRMRLKASSPFTGFARPLLISSYRPSNSERVAPHSAR